MKVSETYILHRDQFYKINWLYDFIFKQDDGTYYPSDRVFIIKIYRTDKDEWYVETPEYSFGRTTTVFANLLKIPKKLIQKAKEDLH